MKKDERISSPAVGAGSLLTIFAILCLTVFAVLSLSSALAEKRLAEASARSVSAYYQADTEAEEIFARLTNAEKPAGVETDGERFYYSCPISERQSLEVCLYGAEGEWSVLSWQATAHTEEEDNTLPVWGSGTGGYHD